MYEKLDALSHMRRLSALASTMTDIEKAKFWIVEFCPSVGGYRGTLEPYPFLADYASVIEKTPNSDLFFDRQKEHIAHAMRMIAGSSFTDPPSAVASVYLATRVEFFFRILAGVLNFDGTWKEEKIRVLYKQKFVPSIRGRRVNDVSVAFKIAIADPANQRTSHLRDLEQRIAAKIKSRHPNDPYLDIGDRIALLRHPVAHGTWGDLSCDAVFYGLLTVVILLSETQL
jgi:hypothetical protein